MFSRDSIVAYALENQIQLKSVQLDSIENVLAKRDTIVVAKTGEGKSLIFQIATSMSPVWQGTTQNSYPAFTTRIE
jgi:superfamily II DNA helicase RecQ